MKLKDKIAIVTGSDRGIGRKIAELMAKEGAKVIITGRNIEFVKATSDFIKSEYNVASSGIRVDVSKEEDVKNLVTQVMNEYGTIDILVSNAGIVRPTKPIEDITKDQWEEVIGINLMGGIFCSKYIIPIMKEKMYGKIIFISSVAGQVGGIAVEATYAVTKAGIICYTKSLAKYLAKYNVNVNCIAPGTIHTNMTDILNYSEDTLKSIPLGRIGSVDDIANAAVYLACDDSNYVTGATLDVNGGINMR